MKRTMKKKIWIFSVGRLACASARELIVYYYDYMYV